MHSAGGHHAGRPHPPDQSPAIEHRSLFAINWTKIISTNAPTGEHIYSWSTMRTLWTWTSRAITTWSGG